MTSVSLFGRSIVQDANSTIKPLDNDTFIIRPAWNTSGLTELRFGILLPFSQTESNVTARVVWGGTSAVRMAINTINSQQMITGAYISLILRDSYPDTNVSNQIAVANAVYASVTLMQQQIIGLIGDISSSWTGLSAIISTALMMPQCSFTSNAMMLSDKSMYKYFFRTIPTQVIFADAMVSFIASQGWAKIGVIYADTSLGQQFFQRAILQTEAHGMDIVQSQAFDPKLDDLTFSIKNVTDSAARVILVAATEVAVAEIVTRAALEGYMNKEYTWLLLGTPDQVLEARIELHNENSTAGPPLSLNSTFNGLFMFDYWFSLNGYAPFDDFARQWAALNVSSYPMAGTSSVFSNEGLAYSCMMMMANGYKRMLDASQNRTGALYSLTAGDRHEYMVPDAFNTGYIGPNGPMTLDSNGDLSQGNFLIYNMQHGQNIQVGRGLSGDLKLTHPLMFYDGTATPPPDTPVSLAMNPSYTSPVSLAILTVSALGILFALIAICMVILYRKHEVFKASSPLFCCLELIGFVLTYVSVIEMLDFPTVSTCYLQPITFTLGFLLVLGPLIAKNYRIYRIFKNVFLTRNVITDWQLIKLTSMVVIVDMILLMVGLCLTRPEPMRRKVPPAAYYWECGTNGSSDLRFAFLIISGVYGALLLLVATYLVYQTRLAGKHYHRYSECRQMGLCVYNILFSALVGYSGLVNPLAGFSTRFYMGSISILWATTFSLLVLFVPKMYLFYRQQRRGKQPSTASTTDPSQDIQPSFLKPAVEEDEEHQEMHDLMMASHDARHRADAVVQAALADASSPLHLIQEGELPVRRVLRWFPFLATWHMQRIMVFPWLGYVSHFTQWSANGSVMAYSHTSVVIDQDLFMLRVHGRDWFDLYIQVASKTNLFYWQQCFDLPNKHAHRASVFVEPENDENDAAAAPGAAHD